MSTDAHTAHHEAGHFVVAYVLRQADMIHRLTIVPDGDAAGQNLGEHPLDDDADVTQVRNALARLYAGFAAHVRFDPTDARAARAMAEADEEQADRILDLLCVDRSRKRTKIASEERTRARRLVKENFHVVQVIAGRILECRTIDGDEAGLIIDAMRGLEGSAENLLRLLAHRWRRLAIGAKEAHGGKTQLKGRAGPGGTLGT